MGRKKEKVKLEINLPYDIAGLKTILITCLHITFWPETSTKIASIQMYTVIYYVHPLKQFAYENANSSTLPKSSN